ncbi:unnamed protein product [Pleuronectes platessa]|uniref:Uncharacterized protein n=1 Tax=Pleuronectes platessa TaxID=8262 RepID=A0A9N7ZD94_PLEPL|nr:unnamed protein product [Pleuronectes platessa]
METQPISNQTDPTIALLQEEKNREIYGGKKPIVFKIKLKKKMKRRPFQTESLAAAAFSEEQPQVEVTVSSTQNTEEETQPINSQTDPTIDILQEEKRSEISQGYGGKEPDQDQDQAKKEEEAQTCSNQATGGWRRFPRSFLTVFKMKLKKMKNRKPAQTEPVAGAASSEEQPQEEVTVSSTQNTEEETQPISKPD